MNKTRTELLKEVENEIKKANVMNKMPNFNLKVMDELLEGKDVDMEAFFGKDSQKLVNR